MNVRSCLKLLNEDWTIRERDLQKFDRHLDIGSLLAARFGFLEVPRCKFRLTSPAKRAFAFDDVPKGFAKLTKVGLCLRYRPLIIDGSSV